MKKVLSFLIVAAVGGVMLFAPANAGAIPVKVSGEVWARWTGTMETNATKRSNLNLWTANRMSIERGYLTVAPVFSDVLSGRLTLDFYTDSENKGWLAGAGMKLKYAYLSWLTPIPLIDLSLVLGLQKSLFGTIYDWEYVTIEKDLADRVKAIKSAENAVAIQGYIPQGFGEFSFQLANGEGYESAGTKLNLNPAYIGNIRFTPVPGVTLGASMNYEYAGFHGKLGPLSETNKFLYTGMVKVAYNPIEVWFQYLEKDRGRSPTSPTNRQTQYLTSHYFMAMVVLSFKSLIGQDLQLVARTDFDDPDTCKEHDGSLIAIVGLNWGFAPDASGKSQAVVQLNYQGKYSEMNTSRYGGYQPTHLLMAQLKWTFGSTIPE